MSRDCSPSAPYPPLPRLFVHHDGVRQPSRRTPYHIYQICRGEHIMHIFGGSTQYHSARYLSPRLSLPITSNKLQIMAPDARHRRSTPMAAFSCCHLMFALGVPCITLPAVWNDDMSPQRTQVMFASSLKSVASPSRRRIEPSMQFTSIPEGRARDDKRRSRNFIRVRSLTNPKRNSALMVQMRNINGGGAPGDYSGENGRSKDWGISLSLFLTYLTVMGAKCALPSTLSMIVAPNSGLAHHNMLLTRQDVMSRLIAMSTVSIAAGKLLLGPVIDSLGGVLSLQIALSTICICLSCIGFGAQTCPTLASFAAYWIVVDFAFSTCWAACVKTIRDYLSEERWAREIGRLAIAARSGNAISFAFFGWLLHVASAWVPTTPSIGTVDASWRWVFRVAGVIQLLPLCVLSYFRKGGGGNSISIVNDDKQNKHAPISTMKHSIGILFQQSRTPEFWLHLVSRSLLMILVSFLLFIPSFMSECYDMSHASSARVGSIFALGCLLSVSTLAEKTYPSGSQSISSIRRKKISTIGFLSTASVCSIVQIAFLQGSLLVTPIVGSLFMFLFGFSLGELYFA